MDIQVSSNFERLLFELLDRDGRVTADVMKQFAETGQFHVDDWCWPEPKRYFPPIALMMTAPLPKLPLTAKQNNMTIDPHSAVGVYAARQAHADGTVSGDVPIVALACAHPAKFDAAVTKATGVTPNCTAFGRFDEAPRTATACGGNAGCG